MRKSEPGISLKFALFLLRMLSIPFLFLGGGCLFTSPFMVVTILRDDVVSFKAVCSALIIVLAGALIYFSGRMMNFMVGHIEDSYESIYFELEDEPTSSENFLAIIVEVLKILFYVNLFSALFSLFLLYEKLHVTGVLAALIWGILAGLEFYFYRRIERTLRLKDV